MSKAARIREINKDIQAMLKNLLGQPAYLMQIRLETIRMRTEELETLNRRQGQ